jgi:hypothetical protein
VKLRVVMRLGLLGVLSRQLNLLDVPVFFSEDLRDVDRVYQLKKERTGGTIFSSSGRKGKMLPQIHAAIISIRDHLITSTLSHVES